MITRVIFLLAFFTSCISASNEVFENSKNLCKERCSCSLSNQSSTLRIDCANKNMRHTIANWPDHPKNLIASFSNNNITTLEQMPGSGAENIQLIFSNCGIKYLNSGLFESTVNVRVVDLSHNLIPYEQLSQDVFKGPYNKSFFEPIALEYLDLSFNLIHSLQRKLFKHTPNLKHLNLEGNAMRVIDHSTCFALSSVPKMQVLNLANNRLTELPNDAINHLPNLTEIDLSQNKLDFVPTSLGHVASSLEKLNVSFNPIVEINHNTFEGFQKLRYLSASYLDQLTVIHAQSFTWLKSLQVIELCHNENLQEVDEAAFGADTTVKEVYFNDNGLEALSVNLLPWDKLEKLNIRDNNLMCDCDLYNISQQLPDGITKMELDVPLCVNPRSFSTEEIYSLTEESCFKKPLKWNRSIGYTSNTYRTMRITLTVLIIVLVVMAFGALWLGYSKWKMYRRNLNYAFPNQIMYSPIRTVS